MQKFLIEGGYTPDGVMGLRKDGASKRRQVVEGLLKEVGGKLEALYFTFGDTDVAYVPQGREIFPLLTVEEMDAAIKKQIGYRGPGQ